MPALDARLLCFELLQLPVEDTTGIDDDDDGCNNDDPDPTADADNDDGGAVRDDGGGGGGIARDWRPPKPLAPPFSSLRKRGEGTHGCMIRFLRERRYRFSSLQLSITGPGAAGTEPGWEKPGCNLAF